MKSTNRRMRVYLIFGLENEYYGVVPLMEPTHLSEMNTLKIFAYSLLIMAGTSLCPLHEQGSLVPNYVSSQSHFSKSNKHLILYTNSKWVEM
ncbi:hypothetical protein Lal_00007911 [Lupinus albus]|nr:hypothetical protein Lal_00007911 [Lupinus albus]